MTNLADILGLFPTFLKTQLPGEVSMAAAKLDTKLHSAGNADPPPACDMGVPMPIKPTPHAESSCPSVSDPRSASLCTLRPRQGGRGWPAAAAHSRMPNARSSLASKAHTWHFSITAVGPCSVE